MQTSCYVEKIWQLHSAHVKKKSQRFDIQIINCQHKVILFPWQKVFRHKFCHMTDDGWKIEREQSSKIRSFKYSVILLFFPITLEIIFPEFSTFYTHNVNKMLHFYSPKWWWIVVTSYRAAKQQVNYPLFFTTMRFMYDHTSFMTEWPKPFQPTAERQFFLCPSWGE